MKKTSGQKSAWEPPTNCAKSAHLLLKRKNPFQRLTGSTQNWLYLLNVPPSHRRSPTATEKNTTADKCGSEGQGVKKISRRCFSRVALARASVDNNKRWFCWQTIYSFKRLLGPRPARVCIAATSKRRRRTSWNVLILSLTEQNNDDGDIRSER